LIEYRNQRKQITRKEATVKTRVKGISWVLGLSLLVAALLIVAGCSTEPDDTVVSTLEDLAGVWRRSAVHVGYGEIFIAFNEDGSYRVATGSVDRIETHPLEEGEVWFEKGQLRIKGTSNSPGWPECEGPAEIGTYEIQRLASDSISFVLAGEPCGGGARGNVLTGEYELVG
jgi:hypothetical protein